MRFESALTDYLSRNPVTGLLIAKDDQILLEHYQYGRTDRDRLISQSMVKSITGVLIGIAIAEGAIKSVDDTAETYVPGFKGTEYGKTPIRDLLHMSSGVEFGEESRRRARPQSLWSDMVATGSDRSERARSAASRNSISGSRHRERDFHYASIEPDVLGHRASLRDQQIGVRTICMKRSGADRRGSRRQMADRCAKALKWRTSASMRCCATTRGLDVCLPMMARGKASRSSRHNG